MTIFLNIDGVLIPANPWRAPEMLEDGFPSFTMRSVAVMQALLATGTDVMLTTSHRHHFTFDEWKRIFGRRELIINRINRLPNHQPALKRMDELTRWFKENKLPAQFVILGQ